MAGSGRAKFLAGLGSLNESLENISARKRQRLLDELERQEFEYRKTRDEEDRKERRQGRILSGRERIFDRLQDMAELQSEAAGKKQGRILGARDKMFGRMIDIGNLRAREEGLGLSREREARLASPDVRASAGSSSALDKARDLRAATLALAGDIAAEKPKALNLDKLLTANRMFQPLEPEAAPAERFLPEASRYTGASDLPMRAPDVDPYEAMSDDEWDAVAWAAIQDAVGRDPDAEKDALESPHLPTITFVAPSQRRRMLMDIPRLFGRPVQ